MQLFIFGRVPEEKRKTQATSNLICKEFDLLTCENEVRTGYLSRYNYMPKPINNCTADEINKAILKEKKNKMNGSTDASHIFQDLRKKIGKIV
jgi:hypothetical protein